MAQTFCPVILTIIYYYANFLILLFAPNYKMNWQIVFVTIIILINYYMLFYVYRIRNNSQCNCANTWVHKIILAYIVINTCILILFFGAFFLQPKLYKKYINKYMVGVFPFAICYTVMTFWYTHHLKTISCECTGNPDQLALQALAVVSSILSSIDAIIILVVSAIGVWYLAKNNSASKSRSH